MAEGSMSEPEVELSITYVYIIAKRVHGGVSRPVKVGITGDPDKRLATIKTACPYPIEIVCVFGSPLRGYAAALELAFHSIHKDKRLHGEWFDMSPLMAAESMCRNYRAMLKTWLKFGEEEIAEAAEWAGVTAVEAKCAEEQTARLLNDIKTVGNA
jgi:hypothetical protein